MIRTLLSALALSLSTAAAAHTFWLEPDVHRGEAGAEMRVAFKIGDAGEAGDWGVFWERVASFRLYGPGGVLDQQRGVRVTGSGEVGSAVVSAPEEGSYVLAFESNPSFSDLEAGRFNSYAQSEGLSAILADREARGTMGANGSELYSRRSKALLQVGKRLTGNVTQPVGHTLEIVPLQNPFALGWTQPLELQVLWRGEPLAGATLSATPLDGTVDPILFRTRNDGKVVVPMSPRPMLYAVVWGVPAPNERRADYLTIFASLTVAGLGPELEAES